MQILERSGITPTPTDYGQSADAFARMGDFLYYQHLNIKNPVNLLNASLNEYAKALELDPENPEFMGKMARVFLRLGNFQKAEQLAQRVLSLQPQSQDAHYVLGFIHLKLKNVETSIHSLNQALQWGGASTSRTRICLYYAHLAGAHKSHHWLNKLGHYGAAWQQALLAGLFSWMDTEPTQLGTLFKTFPGLCKAYLKEQKGDIRGALLDYLKLHESFPGLAPVMNLIGYAYNRLGAHQKAFEWLERAIERDPLNEEGYSQLGSLHEERGDYHEAIKTFEHLLTLRPDDAQIHCSLANLHSNENNYDEAMSYYKAALHLGEDRSWCALIAQTLGCYYQEIAQNSDAAQVSFQMAIDLNPQEVNNYIYLGVLYFERADFTNAELVYKKAAEVDPNNPRIHSNLGYLKWLDGRIDEAVAYYEKSIALDPFYDIPHNNLGVIYLDVLGNLSKAIELIEKAIHLNENYALAYYNLGRAYSFINKRLEAAQCFQRAQHLNRYTKELDNEELTARLDSLFNTFES